MAALKEIFEGLKLAEVETFIASGNVIFTSDAGAARLEALIEQGLQEALGYPVVTSGMRLRRQHRESSRC